MHKINVIGLGPGSVKYITPIAVETMRKSSAIAGGTRNLEAVREIEGLDISDKELFKIGANLDELEEFINSQREKGVSVVATGDPGFYGILDYMLRTFGETSLNVIPGISSIQYMFARINLPWNRAHLGSVHGREENIVQAVKDNEISIFLTDTKNSPQNIAQTLCDAGMSNMKMYIGSDLSYPEEEITQDIAQNIVKAETNSKLSVVVIKNEQ